MLNVGYAWMGLNVCCSAVYVLGMRKVIRKMGFRDWDSALHFPFCCPLSEYHV
jgi:GDP-mannose transporter